MNAHEKTTKDTLAARPGRQRKRTRCEAQGLKPASENGQAKNTKTAQRRQQPKG